MNLKHTHALITEEGKEKKITIEQAIKIYFEKGKEHLKALCPRDILRRPLVFVNSQDNISKHFRYKTCGCGGGDGSAYQIYNPKLSTVHIEAQEYLKNYIKLIDINVLMCEKSHILKFTGQKGDVVTLEERHINDQNNNIIVDVQIKRENGEVWVFEVLNTHKTERISRKSDKFIYGGEIIAGHINSMVKSLLTDGSSNILSTGQFTGKTFLDVSTNQAKYIEFLRKKKTQNNLNEEFSSLLHFSTRRISLNAQHSNLRCLHCLSDRHLIFAEEAKEAAAKSVEEASYTTLDLKERISTYEEYTKAQLNFKEHIENIDIYVTCEHFLEHIILNFTGQKGDVVTFKKNHVVVTRKTGEVFIFEIFNYCRRCEVYSQDSQYFGEIRACEINEMVQTYATSSKTSERISLNSFNSRRHCSHCFDKIAADNAFLKADKQLADDAFLEADKQLADDAFRKADKQLTDDALSKWSMILKRLREERFREKKNLKEELHVLLQKLREERLREDEERLREEKQILLQIVQGFNFCISWHSQRDKLFKHCSTRTKYIEQFNRCYEKFSDLKKRLDKQKIGIAPPKKRAKCLPNQINPLSRKLDPLDHELVKDFTTKADKRKKALISEAFQLEKTNKNKPITLHLFNLYVDGLIRNGYFKHCKEDIEFITAFNVCYFQIKPLGDDAGDGNWVLEEWCDHYRELAISKAKELDLA